MYGLLHELIIRKLRMALLHVYLQKNGYTTPSLVLSKFIQTVYYIF